MNRRIILSGTALCLLMLNVGLSSSAQTLEERVEELERGAGRWRAVIDDVHDHGIILFFFTGIFCALWAQNTGRNAWLWFFLGVIFNFVTLLVLLYKNPKRIRLDREE